MGLDFKKEKLYEIKVDRVKYDYFPKIFYDKYVIHLCREYLLRISHTKNSPIDFMGKISSSFKNKYGERFLEEVCRFKYLRCDDLRIYQ